MLIFNEMEI